MKTFPLVAGHFALSALLLTAQAQTPASPRHNPSPSTAKAIKTADQRAATYQGPKVVKDSKALGRKMVQKSKPTDMRLQPPAPKK